MNTHIEYKGYHTMTIAGGKHYGYYGRAWPIGGRATVDSLQTEGFLGKGGKGLAFAALKALIDAAVQG